MSSLREQIEAEIDRVRALSVSTSQCATCDVLRLAILALPALSAHAEPDPRVEAVDPVDWPTHRGFWSRNGFLYSARMTTGQAYRVQRVESSDYRIGIEDRTDNWKGHWLPCTITVPTEAVPPPAVEPRPEKPPMLLASDGDTGSFDWYMYEKFRDKVTWTRGVYSSLESKHLLSVDLTRSDEKAVDLYDEDLKLHPHAEVGPADEVTE